MSPKMHSRLQLAADYVSQQQRALIASRDIISGLVCLHGASFKPGAITNLLRVAGVQATCTWNEGDGLLSAWVRLATLRLMEARGACSSERERVA